MIAPADFLAMYPQFTAVPTPTIQRYIDQGYSQFSCSLGKQLDYAVELFTAHNIVLWQRATAEGQSGGQAGTGVGMIGSKSVGGAAISYDNAATTSSTEGAGIYNATLWGQLLWPLLRGAQAGPKYHPGNDPFFSPPVLPGRGFLGGWGF